jgi:transposase
MPQPYSADLRERILVAYEQGEGSQVAIARRFRVCPAAVCNWLRQARQEGRRCPKPHRGGPPAGWDRASWRCCRASWLRPTMPTWISMRSACLRSPASGSADR